MKISRAIGALLGAGAIIFALAGTASATSYATVFEHVAFSSDANQTTFWETRYDLPAGSCVTDNGNVDGLDSYLLTQSYGYVIVKAGSGDFANTVFKDPTAGQTVWADTNGNNTFDVGGESGDKQISHIIFCEPSSTTTSTETTTTTTTTEPTTNTTTTTTTTEPTTTTTTTTASTTTTTQPTTTTTEATTSTTQPTTTTTSQGGGGGGGGGGSSSTFTLPATSAFGDSPNPTDHSWMLIAALGMLLGSVLILAPAKVRNRR